jgi:hypothetical protein
MGGFLSKNEVIVEQKAGGRDTARRYPVQAAA